MPQRLLAVELWHAIALELARDDARALLGVSRTFHAVALRILFNLTEIHVGAPSTGPERRAREEVARGILERIPRDAQLAHAVVRLRVHAGDGGLQGKTGWQRLLIRALGSLTHLRAFEWICTPNSYNVLPKRIVTVLSESCKDLDSFSYSCSERNGGSSSEVQRLRGLRSLTFSTHQVDSTLDDVLDANRATLRSLIVTAPLLTDLSAVDLGALTHLEILRGMRAALLAPLLSIATQLRTLVLHGAPPDFPTAPFRAHALPRLRTLRLVGVGPELAEPLAAFLARAPRLRRLHVVDQAPALAAPDWAPLFAALGKLPALDTLGIDLLEPVDGASFAEPLPALPATLRALLVGGTNAIKFLEALPPGVCALHVTTYGHGVPSRPGAGFDMASAAFRACPALRVLTSDAWHQPYVRGADGCAMASARAASGPDYDWLVARLEP